MTETDSYNELWIGGRPARAESGETFDLVNPYTGLAHARFARASGPDAVRAIDAAAAAFPAWSRLTGNDRANVLYRAYHLVHERREELALLMVEDMGKTVREAAKEIRSTGAFIRFCAEEARRIFGDIVPSPDPRKRVLVMPQPVGVVAAFIAANAPGIIFGRKVAPALAAGCSVVVKPSEAAPRVALALARILHEAGVPDGAVNVIAGDAPAIAAAVMADPRVRMVTFTGSAALGRQLMRGASDGMKRVVLELGGVAPFIVFADADLEAAVEGLVGAKFRHSGQICASPQRVFVEAPIAEDFTNRLVDRISRLHVGDPSDPMTDFGPLQHAGIFKGVEAIVEDARRRGARIVVGGAPVTGLIYQPTILADVDDSMEVSREEAFGPIVALDRFTTEEEAVSRGNATAYGLGAYVFTRDLSRAWRVAEALEVGVVGVNDPFPANIEGPFGGVKQSGFGLEGGRYGVEEFLVKKAISFKI